MHHGDDSINYLGHFCAFLTFFPSHFECDTVSYLFDMFKLLQLTFYIVRTSCVYLLYMNVFVTWFPITTNKYLSKGTSIISSWLFRFLTYMYMSGCLNKFSHVVSGFPVNCTYMFEHLLNVKFVNGHGIWCLILMETSCFLPLPYGCEVLCWIKYFSLW